MRTIAVAFLLLTQPSFAAECLAITDPPSRLQVVLTGTIEYKPVKSATPGTVEIFLKLSTPACLEGTHDARRYRKDEVTSIMLGLPANLVGTFQPLDRVRLRGEVWGPTFSDKGEPLDDFMFAVKEVL